TDETLLRLSIAAELEFPDGTVTVSTLRGEAAKGRLQIWRIGNKDFTTRRALRDMKNQCVLPSHPASSYAKPGKAIAGRSGLSRTSAAKSAQALAKASARQLKQRSRDTSSETEPSNSATVIPIKS